MPWLVVADGARSVLCWRYFMHPCMHISRSLIRHERDRQQWVGRSVASAIANQSINQSSSQDPINQSIRVEGRSEKQPEPSTRPPAVQASLKQTNAPKQEVVTPFETEPIFRIKWRPTAARVLRRRLQGQHRVCEPSMKGSVPIFTPRTILTHGEDHPRSV